MRQLMKGNDAIVNGAILAGCQAYFGYPITPASEIAETAALLFPRAGGVFLQAESEIASIQMVYGAASAGVRTMTGSSGPGISLMQEGISYLAGAELPCVVADIMRGGPGLGNIGPEQGDYFQMVKGGGHGNYRNIVLAPNSVQEMCDLTILAFELADRYRNPAVVLADGALGQMMEAVELPAPNAPQPPKEWAVSGEAATRKNIITSIYLRPEELEQHNEKLQAKYRKVEEKEILWEEHLTEDAEFLLVGYGISSRVARATVDEARSAGMKTGLFRPITLFPFPMKRLGELTAKVKGVLVVELSYGQLLEDVRLAANGRAPVRLLSRAGGMIPTEEEVMAAIKKMENECVGNQA
ncbi:MAG: 3-methyl-2-oxobutanoate dehydrogenase subunit VorB [Acidobacteriota bacterium]